MGEKTHFVVVIINTFPCESLLCESRVIVSSSENQVNILIGLLCDTIKIIHAYYHVFFRGSSWLT